MGSRYTWEVGAPQPQRLARRDIDLDKFLRICVYSNVFVVAINARVVRVILICTARAVRGNCGIWTWLYKLNLREAKGERRAAGICAIYL